MGDSIIDLPVPANLGSMCLCVCVCVQSLPTLCDLPASTRLSCPWNWSGLPFPTPGDLLNPGIKPVSLASPPLTGRFFTNGTTWEALNGGDWMFIWNPGTSCISLHSYQKSTSWMVYKWRYWNIERSSDFYIPNSARQMVNLYGLPGGWVVKNPPTSAGTKRHRFSLWIGEILWSRKWHRTSVFLPGSFHGQRSLVGYSPWDSKESELSNQAYK